MKQKMNWPYKIMSRCHNILPTITSSFISSAGMTERVNEFRMKPFA